MQPDVTQVIRIGLKWGVTFAPPGVLPATMEATFWTRRGAYSVADALNSAYWQGRDHA